MSSLIPLGEKIRDFRIALGLTQLELALAADVSERTLRSAEKGLTIRQAHLESIAMVLGIPLTEIAAASRALSHHLTWQRNIAVFFQSVTRAMADQDPTTILDYAHPKFAMNFAGTVPGVESIDAILGHYKGADGVKQFVENVARFWEQDPGKVVTLDLPAGKENLVIVRGRHKLNLREGGTTWGRFTHVAQFTSGRLLSVDSMMVPCDPPSQTAHPLVQVN